MKKIIFSSIVLFFTVFTINAQHATVYFNYENSSFNENQPLPAEKYIMIRGNASPQVQMVKVELLEGKNGSALYSAHWKRPYGNSSLDYVIPFNHKLRSNNAVDLAFMYYRKASENERINLEQQLFSMLDSYIDQIYTVNKRTVSLKQQNHQIISDLNQIVETALTYYENRNEIKFKGFSDMVKLKLDQVESTKLKKAKFFVKDSAEDVGQRQEFRRQLMQELKQLIHLEVQQVLNNELFVVADTKFIYDYQIEKTMSTVAINAGYGGVFFGKTNGADMDYDTAPFVGVSIPFANKKFKKKFWGNLTADIGVFILNMEDDNGETISGPVIKRPIYAGLGYKFLKFVKVQAGYTLLEYQGNGGQFLNTNNIAARPYVGIGVQFDFWMNFSK